MDRYWGGAPRGWVFKAHRLFFSIVVTRQLANPEAILARRDRRRAEAIERSASNRASNLVPLVGDGALQETPHPLTRRPPRFSVVFSGVFLPRFPGMSGGEIRDFHIVRGLLEFCKVSMIVPHETDGDARQQDLISSDLESFWDPARIAAETPDPMGASALSDMRSRRWRLMDGLRLRGWPVLGPKLPRDVEISAMITGARMTGALTRLLEKSPDFLFISPQTNATALFLDKHALGTRFIFATYDVESVRLRRLCGKMHGLKAIGGWLEAARGRRFERSYVQRFDGIIAVSELDRSIFIQDYGVAPERVAVIHNGVDAKYFSFTERRADGPLIVMFPASFGYPPNRLAALRLARRIMPRLWKTHPDAQLWLVGQAAGPDILALASDERIFVTGRVNSVLPYFEQASFLCAPLEMGSGTKTKVIEALSAGLPVVCTALAAEGLGVVDGEHLGVRDSDAGMVAEMVRLFADRAASRAMAAAGRKLVEAEYSWDSVLPKLEPWLDALSSLPRVYPPWKRPPVEPGTVIEFQGDVFGQMTGIGWARPETSHVWSIGREAELWLNVGPAGRRVRLTLSGNPHVFGRRQDLRVSLNGVQTACVPLPADNRTVLDLDCAADAWKTSDVNRVTFELDASASCETDERDLGLCLWSLAIE